MKILICMLFHNSMFWMNRIVGCLEDLLKNKPSNIEYHFSVVYGDSWDGTDKEINRIMDNLSKLYGNGDNRDNGDNRLKKELKIKIVHLPLPKRFDGIEKLGILRNASIELGDLKNEKYDYIIQADTDVIFDNITILKLIRNIDKNEDFWGNKLNAGIIAPMNFIENSTPGSEIFYDTFVFRINGYMFYPEKPYVPAKKNIAGETGWIRDVDKGKQDRKDRYGKDISPDLIKKGIFEVDSVGTLYICKADIFTKWDIKYGTEERTDRKTYPHRRYESEQVYWCNQVRKYTGYKIYVDPDIRVKHLNLEMYGLQWH